MIVLPSQTTALSYRSWPDLGVGTLVRRGAVGLRRDVEVHDRVGRALVDDIGRERAGDTVLDVRARDVRAVLPGHAVTQREGPRLAAVRGLTDVGRHVRDEGGAFGRVGRELVSGQGAHRGAAEEREVLAGVRTLRVNLVPLLVLGQNVDRAARLRTRVRSHDGACGLPGCSCHHGSRCGVRAAAGCDQHRRDAEREGAEQPRLGSHHFHPPTSSPGRSRSNFSLDHTRRYYAALWRVAFEPGTSNAPAGRLRPISGWLSGPGRRGPRRRRG